MKKKIQKILIVIALLLMMYVIGYFILTRAINMISVCLLSAVLMVYYFIEVTQKDD